MLECTLDNRADGRQRARHGSPSGGGPSLFERLLLRAGLIDRLKLQTLDLRNRIAPILRDRVPRWGRGRVDTFNPYKAIQFNWQLDAAAAVGADRRVRLPVALEPGAARRACTCTGTATTTRWTSAT